MKYSINILLFFWAMTCFAASDQFPPYEDAPAITSYVSDGTFNNTYYIDPDGNDTTGDGSIGSPWTSVNGARTGGSGTPAAAGDLVYFNDGTYTATEISDSISSGCGGSNGHFFDIDGTSSERIVFTAAPGATPTFEAPGDKYPNMNIRGAYVVVDSLNFTTGGMTVTDALNVTIQNSTFIGDPHDVFGGQMNDTHLGIMCRAGGIVIRNNYFESGNNHAIKEYQAVSAIEGINIIYNRFYNITVSFGAISSKGANHDLNISYNRFENIVGAIVWGTDYESLISGTDDHFTVDSIDHNVFDNCGMLLQHVGDTTRDLIDLDFHNNIVLNDAGTTVLDYKCDDGDCWDSPVYDMGDFYNNAFYDISDLIDPGTTSNLSANYPIYWNYNAYASTAIRDTAENENSVAAGSWQGSALVQASHGITRTGDAGNRFYTILVGNGFVGAGKDGGNIGGFVFSGTPDSTFEQDGGSPGTSVFTGSGSPGTSTWER